MHRILMFCTILFSIILGSCQTLEKKDLLPKDMNVKDLPEGRAFEDEFTRKQLQSTEEVMPGYYPFLARNGKYKMAFPKEGLTYGGGYTSKDNFEFLSFTDWEEDKPTSASVTVKFFSSFNPGFEHLKKRRLQSNIGVPMDFEEIEAEGQTFYIGYYEDEKESGDRFWQFGYGVYIQNEKQPGGIEIIYSLKCKTDCEETKEADLQEAHDWIQTVEFINDSEEDEK